MTGVQTCALPIFVLAGPGGLEGRGQADHLPAARGGEGFHVLGAQVVGLGLALRGQGPDDDRGVRVHVGQGGDGGVLAAGPAAASDASHQGRLPRAGPLREFPCPRNPPPRNPHDVVGRAARRIILIYVFI